jgi:hypothetical protein
LGVMPVPGLRLRQHKTQIHIYNWCHRKSTFILSFFFFFFTSPYLSSILQSPSHLHRHRCDKEYTLPFLPKYRTTSRPCTIQKNSSNPKTHPADFGHKLLTRHGLKTPERCQCRRSDPSWVIHAYLSGRERVYE